MNDPMKPSTKLNSGKSDSFFGLALAQAFMGFAFGPVAEEIWDAGETLSAIHEDRYDQKRTNGRGVNESVFELGMKKSLAGAFARITDLQSMAEQDRATFRPSYGFSAPALSPAF